ncbi:MAG: hypothetical protein A3F31_02150 [Candidatus Levybacteria bacterium RIFCSPHIGHO2_12_FULL_38_12]|nr:MAG: hypothetical protein A2770_03070 [Candidatus Levybacteria bacterium RIFCSPHIGHO2_01_FULL_38_12]OGH22787.1 MAG: hypothetical protein A3F31_02150 [Candidatus Levybacteria bacterium RIFCSPHIGHO2_12_FULL_38_12]OGH33992.1 MAG: hypothetical protein A3A47_00355 [Candidatus Levybacteria bacterium RIFCSPLOWO2_01_FULL_37_20]OGH44796.1 MAG: hypothetical protein A3J14_04605 [Candidatus Levybacteria bacterium RIFCSPLOWO2_02_FULL_37_18]
MPYRKTPIVAGETYHVFNRSIAGIPIFTNSREYHRILEIINFYRHGGLPLRYSHFNRLTIKLKNQFTKSFLDNSDPIIDILSYCIMPNHVHFLLRQIDKSGISHFMRNLQNSYSKYFNIINTRSGSLFQSMFKAVRIETNEQLLHVSRYIHLNPVSYYIVKVEQLHTYIWSSYNDYISEAKINSFVNEKTILNQFKSKDAYRKFVMDQADYQRQLTNIRHLILE